MIAQSKGKMFLSAERGHTEGDGIQSLNTFRNGSYQHLQHSPCNNLYVLNCNTLAGGKRVTLPVEEDSELVLIPIVGAVMYQDSLGNATIIEAGQALRIILPSGTTVSFENPYEEDLIQLLQVWVKNETGNVNSTLQVTTFHIEQNKNALINLFAGGSEKAGTANKFYVAKVEGREEMAYPVSQGTCGIFVYVMEGAFEVANRLLETGDGLLLWDITQVEMEALSNNAIILLIDLED